MRFLHFLMMWNKILNFLMMCSKSTVSVCIKLILIDRCKCMSVDGERKGRWNCVRVCAPAYALSLSFFFSLDMETEFIDRKLNLQFSGQVIH